MPKRVHNTRVGPMTSVGLQGRQAVGTKAVDWHGQNGPELVLSMTTAVGGGSWGKGEGHVPTFCTVLEIVLRVRCAL